MIRVRPPASVVAPKHPGWLIAKTIGMWVLVVLTYVVMAVFVVELAVIVGFVLVLLFFGLVGRLARPSRLGRRQSYRW